MDLAKIISKKAEAAKYMEEEITTIIKTMEKRDPGSVGEKQSVDYMAKQLEAYTDSVVVEPFDVYPASFMGWIYISVTFMFLAIAAYFFMPLLSLVLIIVGVTIMMGEFVLYKKTVDKLFEKKTSYNITAIKKPKGEVKARLFYNGHPDAAWEWPFNYYFGAKPMMLLLLMAFAGIAYITGVVIASIIIRGANQAATVIGANDILNKLGYGMFAFVPAFFAMYFFWNEKRVVDGANDNLSGCYMGIAIVKALKEEGIELENTEVGVLITGSEEAGLRGAKAWAEAHKDEYKDVPTYIFAYDTIRAKEWLGVNNKDLNGTVTANKETADLFRNAALKLGVTCIETSVPLGATDSAAFTQGGFKSIGITGMDHDLQRYYHTREDSYNNMDKEALADCYAASVQALEDLENQVASK
jgi:aminopeptidase YwaD